ncbi:MAG: hypothetical protein HY940_03280 [Gammaproteobacteria bacterium]|nr:hypothetical protein [Gammaproteobacteria bacterium]
MRNKMVTISGAGVLEVNASKLLSSQEGKRQIEALKDIQIVRSAGSGNLERQTQVRPKQKTA